MEQRTLGKYEIRGTLGRGAAGVVYEGWDPLIARRVAIKTVHLPDPTDMDAEDILARCRREAQAAGRLQHPNIVSVFDYGETDSVAYIVMEYIDGTSLKALLDAGEPLPPGDAVRIMGALLTGLQYSHDRGVVHRDIKPANIMLTSQNEVKIADFGIARIENSLMTRVGTVMGTPAYMSPEQFSGETVDARSDIYSAGVVLFQMLTGERPFDGSMSSIMHKALYVQPPRPSDIAVTAPLGLDEVVARAMAKRPPDRYESADAFGRALRVAFEAPAPVYADPTMVREKPAVKPAAPPRRPIVAIALGGVLAAAAGLAAWHWTRPPKPEIPVAQVTPPPAPVTPPPATVTAPPPTVAPPQAETQPPPPPVVAEPPPPPQPAAIGLAEARHLATAVPCSFITVDASGGGFRLSGIAPANDRFQDLLDRLRDPNRPVENVTEAPDFAYCAVLDTLRGSERGDGPRLVAPEENVSSGSKLDIRIDNLPEGALIVDLYATDGLVRHLTRRMVPHGGTSQIDAAAPPGPGLLVATALPSMTEVARRPGTEKSSAYLQFLGDELRRQGAAGVDAALVTVRAAPVPPRHAPESVRSRLPALKPAKCQDIVTQFQLGEAVSDADRAFLQTSCK